MYKTPSESPTPNATVLMVTMMILFHSVKNVFFGATFALLFQIVEFVLLIALEKIRPLVNARKGILKS